MEAYERQPAGCIVFPWRRRERRRRRPAPCRFPLTSGFWTNGSQSASRLAERPSVAVDEKEREAAIGIWSRRNIRPFVLLARADLGISRCRDLHLVAAANPIRPADCCRSAARRAEFASPRSAPAVACLALSHFGARFQSHEPIFVVVVDLVGSIVIGFFCDFLPQPATATTTTTTIKSSLWRLVADLLLALDGGRVSEPIELARRQSYTATGGQRDGKLSIIRRASFALESIEIQTGMALQLCVAASRRAS